MKARIRTIGWMFGFLGPHAPIFLFGICLYGGQGFLTSLVGSLFNRWLTQGMLAQDAGAIWGYTWLYIGIISGYFAVLGLGVYLFVKYKLVAERAMKFRLFRAFVTASVEGRAHSGEGIAAINTEADMACEVLDNSMAWVVGCLISILGAGVTIFLIDVRMGTLALGIGVVALLIQTRFSGPLERLARARLDANAAATKTMTTMLAGAANLRIFNLQKKVLGEYGQSNGVMLAVSLKEAWIATLRTMLTTVQGWLSLAGVFGVGGYLVATGSLGMAELMMIPTLCVVLADGLGRIGSTWAALQGPIVAADRVAAILETGDRAEAVARGKRARLTEWDGGCELRADHLSFRYLGAEADALSDVSLHVKKNEMVALVGASGSGKSTLLRALIGMYERDDMDIRFGNLQFADTPAEAWRGHFAYVDQSCTLFAMSAADNIALGKEGATRDEVAAAATDAQADAFLRELPEGYDTPCGERGASLSGGQKQRVAIARALVRRAPVLVFDEATSALDAESARQVMETIERLRKDHTILITTHDLPSIRSADRIVVMKEGRVVQCGSHERLLAEGGEYVRLIRGEG